MWTKGTLCPTVHREVIQGLTTAECQNHLFRRVDGVETDRIQVYADMGSTLTSVHRKFVAEAQTKGRIVTMRNTEGTAEIPNSSGVNTAGQSGIY